jgi:hypothetical protein
MLHIGIRLSVAGGGNMMPFFMNLKICMAKMSTKSNNTRATLGSVSMWRLQQHGARLFMKRRIYLSINGSAKPRCTKFNRNSEPNVVSPPNNLGAGECCFLIQLVDSFCSEDTHRRVPHQCMHEHWNGGIIERGSHLLQFETVCFWLGLI